jgi:hypothetical protein
MYIQSKILVLYLSFSLVQNNLQWKYRCLGYFAYTFSSTSTGTCIRETEENFGSL